MFIDFDYLENDNWRQKEELYSKICVEIASIIDELDGYNIFEQFYFYCYLLWNGYLSIDKKYEYTTSIPVDELLTIFLGNGCCHHDSKLLYNVLFYLGNMDPKLLQIFVKKMNFKNIMNIKQHIAPSPNSEKHGHKLKRNNHQVVLTPANNSLFLLDSTNLSVCEIINNQKIVCYNGMYRIEKKSLKNNLALPEKYRFNSQPSINTDLLRIDYGNAREKCEQNQALINDFYTANHENYEKAKQLVLNNRHFF